MGKSKFKVGDKVKIIVNEIQSNMVGKIGQVKKVYPSFSEEPGYEFLYRVEVAGVVLKGVATDNDLEHV